MNRDRPSEEDDRTAADWYVDLDRGRIGEREASALAAWLADDLGNEAAFDRCQAATLLIPRVRVRPDVHWAFREAAELVTGRAHARRVARNQRWYQRAGPAWAVAGLAIVVAAAALLRPLAPPGEAEVHPAVAQQPPALEERSSAATSVDTQPLVGPAVPIRAEEPMADLIIDVPFHEPAALLPGEVVVDARSVAVLPFRELMTQRFEDASQVAASQAPGIAAALNEAVVRRLTEVPGIYVVTQQSVAPYSGQEFEPEDIAVQLGVRGVVEGWVDAEPHRVRLYLRLTDVSNEAVIDTTFDHPLESLPALQTDVVRTIRLALNTAPRSEARPASFQPLGGIR